MTIDVAVVGLPRGDLQPSPSTSLVLRCIAAVSGSTVKVTAARDADLVLLYPYNRLFSSNVVSAATGAVANRTRWSKDPESYQRIVRRIIGAPHTARIVAISHENLDRRPWNGFGEVIRQAGLPRLTLWPHEVDPEGYRFPYWWNYVDWPEIPRPDFGPATRFGRLYPLSALREPRALDTSDRRMDKAVWVTRHLDFPRASILHALRRSMEVDVLSNIPMGGKYEVLSWYRYCVVSENSPGYGYETEKVPEACVAGCVPIGHIANPLGDFNPSAAFFLPPNEPPTELPPLLAEEPSLAGLLHYLAEVLR